MPIAICSLVLPAWQAVAGCRCLLVLLGADCADLSLGSSGLWERVKNNITARAILQWWPAGLIWVAIRLIPEHVWEESKVRAATEPQPKLDCSGADLCPLGFTCGVWLISGLSAIWNWFWATHAWIPAVSVPAVMVLAEVVFSVWHVLADRKERIKKAAAADGIS